MVSHRGFPRAVAVLAALLMLLTAVSQAVAAPDTGSEQVAATGHVHHLDGDFNAETRERVNSYAIANPDRDLNMIIGSDDRVQVTQTDQYPNSAIAYIEAYNEAQQEAFRCTATFVAPDVLLTAAHCLFVPELGGWPDGVLVIPGISGENEPFGYEFAADVWVPGGWLDVNGDINEGYAHDYGLIKLPDASLGDQVGTWEVGVLSTETLQAADFNPTTAGYPADKAEITQWTGSQPSFTYVDDVILEHDIDSFQGQSGSAVWRGADRAIVGVMSFETQEHNYARRIDQATIESLVAGCEQMSCSFDYFVEGEGDETPPPPPPGDDTPPPPDDEVPPPPEEDVDPFQRTWNRTDKPVQDGQVSRTWMWGPSFTDVITERYDDSPNGERDVIYHEKSRMEITDPAGDASATWYVTNGLLAQELVTGNLQLGDDTFEQHQPGEINAAGDMGDPNAPTYATFGSVLDAAPLEVGMPITAIINRAGEVDDGQANEQALGTGGQLVTAAYFVPETNHTVASPFWDFMNSSGLVYEDGQFVEDQLFEDPFFATGFPITEAYWATVNLDGEPAQVLIQVFERRVLTYTPDNPDGWQVEAGNVGTHYYQWRYEQVPGDGGETPPPPPAEDPDPTPPPADDVPAEGETIFTSDLTEVQPLEEEDATGAPSENGYVITAGPGGELGVVRQDEFGDGSYSVEFRVTAPATSGAGCLIVQELPDGSSHQFCAVYSTETKATGTISSIVANDLSPESAEPIESWEISPVDASEWHELKVITVGNSYWVLFDGALVGSLDHESQASGKVGFSAINLEDAGSEGTTAEVEFTNLTAKALQQ